MQVGHAFSPARQKEMPSVGAVVAYESLRRRKASDFLRQRVRSPIVVGQGGCYS